MQTNQEKMPEQLVTRKRLMIVENELIVAMDISYQLEEMGDQIYAVVDNGEDAIFAAKKRRSLILEVAGRGLKEVMWDRQR